MVDHMLFDNYGSSISSGSNISAIDNSHSASENVGV